MRWIASLAVAVLVWAVAPRAVHAQQEGDYTIENFHFTDGETMPQVRQHWMTLGKPRTNAKGLTTNAVLILHGTTGTGRQFLSPVFAGVLYGPGQLLDTTRYYIILPDAIGHGKSSKPSDGLHAHFPKYDYADMIRAEYEMLTKGLKVNHLLIVMGTSMGGMHSWMWGEMYPEYMDGLMPLASLPTAMSGRNRMMRHMMVEDITQDPAYDGGDYKVQPRGLSMALQLMFMMTSSPRQLQKHHPTTDSADAYIDRWQQRMVEHEDANDYIYAFEASRDYDPEPKLGLIKAPLIAVNSEDDQVNPPKLGVMERDVPKVKHGQYVLIPTSDATRGHGTHTMAAIWQSHLADLLKEIKQNTGR